MKWKYLFDLPRRDHLNMTDTIIKPTFKCALENAANTMMPIWISIGALVNEHVIGYNFMTYRMAISNRIQERVLLTNMLGQIRICALQFGYLVGDLSTDLSWDTPSDRKRIVPGINMHAVTSLGLLAKDVESGELLAVKDI